MKAMASDTSLKNKKINSVTAQPAAVEQFEELLLNSIQQEQGHMTKSSLSNNIEMHQSSSPLSNIPLKIIQNRPASISANGGNAISSSHHTFSVHNHQAEMTPVSPKSPMDLFTFSSLPSNNHFQTKLAKKNPELADQFPTSSLVTALKSKLKNGLVYDHSMNSNGFSHSTNDTDYISTLDCMELCGLLLPILKRDILTLVPAEIAFKVLEYLGVRTIISGRLVSKTWLGLIDGRGADLAIWKRKIAKEFPHLMIHNLNPIDQKLHLRSYKAYYQFNFLTRRNWFLGRNKRISFPGHGGNVVTSLLVVGDKIISGSDDMSIHIYDIYKGELTKRLIGHDGGVWALQNYGNALVSGSTDRTVRIWNMETGICTHVFDGHTSTVRCLLILPQDGDFVNQPDASTQASTTRKSTILTRSSSSLYTGTSGSTTPTSAVPKTPPPPLFVTGSRDANIRVWTLPDLSTRWNPSLNSTPNPYLRHVLQGHTNSVRAIAGHANILVSGSYDTTVRVWDILTGACLHVFHAHREKVYSVGYSHELKRAVSGSMDATVRVWDTVTGTPLFTLEGHNSLVGLLELTPKYLISAAADSTLRVWDPMSGKCLSILSGHDAAITCFMHDPSNNRIVSGSDGGIKVWELSSDGYNGIDMNSLSNIIPASNQKLFESPSFMQTPKGYVPIYGRFIGDVITQVRGVWRTRMDSHRLVSAVQTSDEKTWFEVLDFSESSEIGTVKKTAGDRFFRDPDLDGDEMEDDMDEGEDFGMFDEDI